MVVQSQVITSPSQTPTKDIKVGSVFYGRTSFATRAQLLLRTYDGLVDLEYPNITYDEETSFYDVRYVDASVVINRYL